jgi:hypothetical protein
MTLDSGAWIGVAGLVLSIPMGIISALPAPRCAAFLEARKLISKQRYYNKLKKEYELVGDLHERKRDKYIYLNRLYSIITWLFICAAANFVFYVDMMIPLGPADVTFHGIAFNPQNCIFFVSWFVLSVIAFFIFNTYKKAEMLTWALDNFEEYEKKQKAKMILDQPLSSKDAFRVKNSYTFSRRRNVRDVDLG